MHPSASTSTADEESAREKVLLEIAALKHEARTATLRTLAGVFTAFSFLATFALDRYSANNARVIERQQTTISALTQQLSSIDATFVVIPFGIATFAESVAKLDEEITKIAEQHSTTKTSIDTRLLKRLNELSEAGKGMLTLLGAEFNYESFRTATQARLSLEKSRRSIEFALRRDFGDEAADQWNKTADLAVRAFGDHFDFLGQNRRKSFPAYEAAATELYAAIERARR